MAIMTRIKNIFRSNINSILDEAEDPLKALDLVGEDMRSEIAKAKRQVSDAIAQQILMKNDLEEANAAARDWTDKAESALESDREDLAREALKENKKAKERAAYLKPRTQHFLNESNRLKEELEFMEERYEEFLAKKETLVAQAKVAQARSAISTPASPSLSSKNSGATLGRAKDKIKQMEARVEADREVVGASSSSSDKFAELERIHKESNIDDELAKLKAKLGK